jgi:hypothetical protein
MRPSESNSIGDLVRKIGGMIVSAASYLHVRSPSEDYTGRSMDIAARTTCTRPRGSRIAQFGSDGLDREDHPTQQRSNPKSLASAHRLTCSPRLSRSRAHRVIMPPSRTYPTVINHALVHGLSTNEAWLCIYGCNFDQINRSREPSH